MNSNTTISSLKRQQRSTESLPPDDRPSKKAREVGRFSQPTWKEEFNDPSNPLVTKNKVGDNSATGSTLQERPGEIPPESSHLSREVMDSIQHISLTRKNVLRHYRSFGGLAPSENHSSDDFVGSTRPRSMSGSSSPDKLDLLGAEDREFALLKRGGGAGFAGTKHHPRLLPRVHQDIKRKEDIIGLSAAYGAPVYDAKIVRDTSVQFPRHRGASSSSSYSHEAIAYTSTNLPPSQDHSGEYVHNSGYSPKRPETPTFRALAVDANEVNTPSLSNQVSNSLDDDSAGLPIDIETIQEDLPEDLQEEVDDELNQSKIEMADMFEELGLPLSPDRIPRGKGSKGGKVKYHTASTVTRNILEEHGSWEFGDEPRWKHLHRDGKKRKLEPATVYVPIELTGDLVDIMESPAEATTANEPPDVDLHSNVELFLDGRKSYIEHPERKIILADYIATEEVRNDRVDRALLMPVVYKAILDRNERQLLVRKRNAEAGLNQADDEELSPASSPLRQTEVHSPSDGISGQVHKESVGVTPSIAEQFIKQHKLGQTLEDAVSLQQYLKAQEPEYTRRGNNQRLCEKTGTAEERRRLGRKGEIILLSTIEYASIEFIEKRDKTRRVGNAMVNEYASDPNFAAVGKVLQWVNFRPLEIAKSSKEKKEAKPDALSEVTVESHVGPLVKGIFWGHEHLKESANKSLRFLRCLRLFGTSPKADYAARLSGENWKAWGPLLAVCLVSGECKPSANFTTQTDAQLAMNSVAGLIMIILMHLSTRRFPNQKLLPWMFLYAFVYTEDGITIYAHFPKLMVAAHGKPHWKFVSWKVSDKFQSVWTSDGTEELRLLALATVYLMRSHTEFVLEQLLAWSQRLPKSAESIIKTLIARAKEEMDVYQKALRKLHTGVAKRIEA